MAGDGNSFACRIAKSHARDAPSVVLIPDVRGLHPYYERLTEYVASAGFHACAIDLYGRTAGPEFRDTDFDWKPHRDVVTRKHATLDVEAAASKLRGLGGTSVATWGFCFGGWISFLHASRQSVDAAIGFYGWPARQDEDGNSPISEAKAGLVRVPVLAIYGGGDAKIGEEDRREYEEALKGTRSEHRSVTYDGAPHSFFDRNQEEYEAACRDAWTNVLEFLHGSAPDV